MSFATEIVKSVNNLRILAEIDLSQLNTQWVNIGSGIWYVNAENIYTYVDDTLLSGFTAQDFAYIGSVLEDGLPMTKADSLLELSSDDTIFYYDGETRSLYIRCTNSDEPSLHTLYIGVVYPLSYHSFVCDGISSVIYGRLQSIPSIGISRDPLFYGKLSYDTARFRAINADGYFDTFGESTSYLYGSECRVKVGFDGLAYSTFQTLTTKYIENVIIDEQYATFYQVDRRKLLSKRIRYDCTDKNGVEAIQEILEDYLGFTYSSLLYDQTAWAEAIAASRTVTIDMSSLESYENEEAITIIGWICSAVRGLFIITADNKFSFKIVDTSQNTTRNIPKNDVLDSISVSYDPSEVISSIRVGYGRDWSTTQSPYTYYTDDTRESTVYNKYRVYNEHVIDTVLHDLADAAAFASDFLDDTDEVFGRTTIRVPLKYYDVELGDLIAVNLERETTTMIGIKKCEVLGKRYDFDGLAILLDLRIISALDNFTVVYDFNGDATDDTYDFNGTAGSVIYDFNGGQ